MSLAVPAGLLEQAYRGEVDDEVFLDCVRDSLPYAWALITGLITTIAWVIATFVTPPETDETLMGFYRRVHPTVYGWRRIARLVPELLP